MAESKKYEVAVRVTTQYLEEQSSPEEDRYVFSYTVLLENTGNIPAQLVSRHWIITDGKDEEQVVRGLGVVGRQPLLAADETFEYSSGCALATPVGTMRGSYQMVAEDGTHFEVLIPEFALAVPSALH